MLSSGGTLKPRQKLPLSKKDKDWREQSFKHYTFASNASNTRRVNYMEHLYKVANGYLEEEDYEHVLNPLGDEGRKNPKYRSFPAKLRNFDIISPVVNSLLGQMLEIGFDYTVVNKATDIDNEYLRVLSEGIKQNILIDFNIALQDNGIDTGIPKEQKQSIEELKKQASSYNKQKSKEGRIIMDYINSYNELPMKFLRAWYDFIVTGTCFSRRDVYLDETIYEIVNPLNIRYVASDNIHFVEDAESVSVDYFMTPTETLDFFQDSEEFMTNTKIIDYLEKQTISSTHHSSNRGFRSTDYFEDAKSKFLGKVFGASQGNPRSDGNIKVTHTCFKSWRKIGELNYQDIFGEWHVEEVGEDFIPMKGEKVTWRWVNEVWEGFSIDEIFFFDIMPIPLQRGTLDNPSKCKLPYNGRILDSRVIHAESIVEKGVVFQEKYNIIQYNIEMSVAKNLDKIIVLPLSLVPDTEDMDMFGQMYYTKAMGYMYIDDSDKKKLQALQYIKVLDTGLNQYITHLYDIAAKIKQEYEEKIGFVRQMKGEINSSDTNGNVREAVFRGSLYTAHLFEQFRQFQQRDLQALLDLSKFAFIEGKKESFLTSAGKEAWLSLEPEAISQASYGLFIKNSLKEREMREQLKMRAQEFAQNGSTPSDIAKILKYSYDEIEDYLAQKEQEMREMAMAQSQAEQETEKYKQESENYNKSEERRVKEADSVRQSDTKIKVALINMQTALTSNMTNLTPELQDTAQASIDDIGLKIRELEIKERDSQRKAAAAVYKSDTDLKIAKENKFKHEK